MDVRGGERLALASQLAQVLAMVRELEARMDQDLPAAARELCGALASSVDRSIRIASSCAWPPESPRSGHGSPRSDAAQDPANAGACPSKRRKGMPCVRRQVRVASVQDMAALDDGLSWRKYGQKDILGAKYPRAYFRCTHRHSQNCHATKQVQRADGDPLLYNVAYHGAHTCAQAAHAGAEQLRQELLHSQSQPGQEQEQSSLLAVETDGLLQAALDDPTAPLFPFVSTPGAGAKDDVAVGGCFPFPFPLLSPTGLDWQQLRSSHAHAAADLGVGMDLEAPFEDFFPNLAEPFQWEFQDLYAAN